MKIKNNPRYKIKNTLKFDNYENTPLNIEEKASIFLSKYLQKMDPVSRYKDYFDSSGYSIAHLLKIVKNNYKTLVLDKGWEEVKFVTITNEIFEIEFSLTPGTYDFLSRMYDKGKLNSQKRR